jgi:hypothetical protein
VVERRMVVAGRIALTSMLKTTAAHTTLLPLGAALLSRRETREERAEGSGIAAGHHGVGREERAESRGVMSATIALGGTRSAIKGNATVQPRTDAWNATHCALTHTL